VQKVLIGEDPQYQLRVGMDNERDLEFIPVHRTAYALKFPLKEAHETVDAANAEKDALMEWLKGAERRVVAAG
jgi:hypothetical protein